MTASAYRVAWLNRAGRRVRTSNRYTTLAAVRGARDAAARTSHATIIIEALLDGTWEAYE